MEEITEEIKTDKEQVTILTDDERELTCQIIMIFRINDQKYIVLVPEDGSSAGNGFLMRFSLDEEGGPVVDKIEDNTEYEHASSAFRSLFGDEENQGFSFEE